MIGGAGNDTYYVDNAGDAVIESGGEGNDTVFASVNYGLAAERGDAGAAGQRRPPGLRQRLVNTLFGNTGNNLLNGGGGADTMSGGAGNDTYFVDNAVDTVHRECRRRQRRGLRLRQLRADGQCGDVGAAGLRRPQRHRQRAGQHVCSAIPATTRSTAVAAPTSLTGDAGNDTFVFKAGEANGDMIVDFAGNGAAAGNSLQFVGYGPGATFTNIDPTHWQVNYNGGSSHDIITFANAASIDATDFIFL